MHLLLFGVVLDVFFFRLCRDLFGWERALGGSVLYAVHWFTLYCVPRTLTNSVETCLLVVSLYYYSWPPEYYVSLMAFLSHNSL